MKSLGVPYGAMDSLTPRQKEVLDLFISGLTYRQVAERCGISPETVNPHLKVAARKLGARGIGRAVLKEAVDAVNEDQPQ